MIIPKFIYKEIIKYKQSEAAHRELNDIRESLSLWLKSLKMPDSDIEYIAISLRDWGLLK